MLALGAAAASCRSLPPDITAELERAPREFWVVASPERECLPELQLLLEEKRAQGFLTQVVGFDPARGPEAAWKRVVANLRTRPGIERAYLLVLATPAELPMGPWALEEEQTAVLSDLPLALELPLAEARTISRAELEAQPRWLVGRIPFADGALVARALRSACEFTRAGGERTALLGARRFLLPGDSSAALARAKAELVRNGIASELWADSPPRDRALGEHWQRSDHGVWAAFGGGDITVYERFEDVPPGRNVLPAKLSEDVSTDFLARWVERAPALVYLLAHASANLHSMGRALLGTSVLAGWDTRAGPGPAPPRPALLLASGCSIGQPDEPLVRELFARGFVAACAASTAVNGPLPLGPTLDAQRDVASFLAQGASLGLAVELVKQSYDRAARRTITWWVWPFARKIWAMNLASYVVYGDPSLALP